MDFQKVIYMGNICYLFDIDILERKARPTFPKLPNHALMKFSRYYKNKGYKVQLIYKPSLIPIQYNPNNVYIGSALYTPNLKRFKKRLNRKLKYPNQLQIKHIHIGTPTDTCPITDLEGLTCDYTEYDKMIETDKINLDWYPCNVGFLTRGCKRHCDYCVNRNKDKITKVNSIWEIYQKKGEYIELLDDNLLASDDAVECLNECADFYNKTHIPIKLRNGLDCRVVPDDKLQALQRASPAFKSGFHCAWDDVRNTYIFRNIMKVNKSIPNNMYCYMIYGVEIQTEEEMRKDILGFFYRYLMLHKIGVRPISQLYEDDRDIYKNPFLNAYKLIKSSYNVHLSSASQYLRRKKDKSKLKICDEIEELLGEYSYVTKRISDIRDLPNFNDKMKQIANELKIKHIDVIPNDK